MKYLLYFLILDFFYWNCDHYFIFASKTLKKSRKQWNGDDKFSKSFSHSSVQDIQVYPDALTITSIQFNPNSHYSDWIQRIFGSQAIFNQIHNNFSIAVSPDPISIQEDQKRHDNVKEYFELPVATHWPKCSFESLGYAFLDAEEPIKESTRKYKPSFGKASLQMLNLKSKGSLDHDFPCVYRALYENWRFSSQYTRPNHWVIVFYCPIMNTNACNKIEKHIQVKSKLHKHGIDMEMVMHLHQVTWKTSFVALLHTGYNSYLTWTKYLENDHYMTNYNEIGVCLGKFLFHSRIW